MATLSELITTLKGKMLPLAGGTLTGALTAPSVSITNDNAKVNGKNIVRSVNGTVAGTDGNVAITIPSGYVHPSTHPASMITGLATVATSGKYSDLSGKPSLATVATSGNYNDLLNKPMISTSGVTQKYKNTFSLNYNGATKTITGLTANKPVFIVFKSFDACRVKLSSGFILNDTSQYDVSPIAVSDDTTFWVACVPTGTSISLFYSTNSNNMKTTVVVYQ